MAARCGHLELVMDHKRRLCRLSHWPMGPEDSDVCAFMGYIAPFPVVNHVNLIMGNAIKGGQLHVLQLMHYNVWKCGLLQANQAALYNRLEILKWMRGFGLEMNEQGLNWAIERKLYDIVAFYYADISMI